MAKKKLFTGQFKGAHAAAQDVLRKNSQEFEAVLVLAAIAIEHDNVPGGQKLCDMLVARGIESCWLYVLLARLALMQQDQETARRQAMVAQSLGTSEPHIANQLGVVLSRTGRHSEAVKPMQTAVDGVPTSADYRYNLAVALQFVGRLDEAEAQFIELVSRHPDHASGWLALVQLADTPEPKWTKLLEAQFARTTDAESRLLIGHALARVAETNKDWDGSLDWLRRAKQKKQGEVSHDRGNVEELVDAAVEAAASRPLSDQPQGAEQPLFIVGLPRSGTTLIERILTSHSEVTSVGELSDFAIVLKQAVGTSGRHVLDPEVLRAAAKSEDIGSVGDQYLRRARALAPDTSRFIDKMPFNSFFVPAILRAIPGARVICLRRSPLDVVFANYRQLFATGFSYYSYNYDLADTAHFVAQFDRMVNTYNNMLPQGRFMAIAYEDVIANQRQQTEKLLEFCGLDWEESCMTFHTNAAPVATASSVQVRQPLYSSSIDQWRRYGDGAKLVVDEMARYQTTAN